MGKTKEIFAEIRQQKEIEEQKQINKQSKTRNYDTGRIRSNHSRR